MDGRLAAELPGSLSRETEWVAPVLGFLRCRTPPAWIEAALADLATVLRDHASLELKAAQQAQKLIWRYGSGGLEAKALDRRVRAKLVHKMSRLAREELRHFEQVIDQLDVRGIDFDRVTASRYARTLHEEIREAEPARCVDTLIVSAIIEARSCERFYSLAPALQPAEPGLARFYTSLLRAEARHFENYLALAASLDEPGWTSRCEMLLGIDAKLIKGSDRELRFHSGPPA